MVAWAGERPFAWFDDESTDTDQAWVRARHPCPALVHRVDARYGLSDADFAVLEGWLRELGTGL